MIISNRLGNTPTEGMFSGDYCSGCRIAATSGISSKALGKHL